MRGTFINLLILWVTTISVTGQERFLNFNQSIFDDQETTKRTAPNRPVLAPAGSGAWIPVDENHRKDPYTIKVEPLGYLTGIEHSGRV